MSKLISRRDLIKQFGMAAFLLHPILRSMNYAMASPTEKFPRFVMWFKGGALIPRSNNPMNLSNLSGTALAPLQSLANDIILFKKMNIHGGSPKTDAYKEEHGAGLYGCVTGHKYKYSGGDDAYYAYTDHESIDIHIANFYKTRPELKHLAFPSLHIGAGAHSDADSKGLGQKYISFRNRVPGDTRYGNAITPIQNANQVYKMMIGRVNNICSGQSNRPESDTSNVRAAMDSKKSVLDFILNDINTAKKQFGMDSEHATKLNEMAEGWRQTEKLSQDGAAPHASSSAKRECPTMTPPTGDGTNKDNLDQLGAVNDQMISLAKMAFEFDLTRVLAYTSSGASCGQSYPSKGIEEARHHYEHAGDTSACMKIDTFHVQKFAKLLAAIKTIDDGNGQNGLYNTSAILGMECWSCPNHYLTDIPFVLAGQGGGRFKTGQIVNAQGRNNNDLLISCLQASGIQTNVFGLESLCKGPIV